MVEIINKMSSLVKDPDLERLRIELNTPNFFNILKVERKEIRHSKFLAWLLDPKGSHSLSDIYLKWFLKDIFSDYKIDWITEFDVESLNLSNIRIYREWKNIDVLIESDTFVVAIENKVDSERRASFRKTNIL